MGSVSYRKVGSRWHIRFREQGDEKVKTFDGSLPEYAIERKSRWFKQEWKRGYFNPFEEDVEDIRLTTAVDKYCRRKREKGDWNRKTAEISRERLGQAADFIGKQKILSTLRSDDFQEWIRSLEGSPYTRQSYRSTLNTFLKWCYNKHYTSRLLQVALPERDYEQIQSIDESDYLTRQQLRTVIDYFNTNSSQILPSDPLPAELITDTWQLMFWQLLSKRDILNLGPSDILEDGTRIQLKTKEGTSSILPLVPPARKILDKYQKSWDHPKKPVFSLQDISSVEAAFKQTIKQCLNRSRPDLRQLLRGGIIHYLSLGKPVQHVSRLARHQNLLTTVRKYGDYLPDEIGNTFEQL
mgnify:CR=1 FL=1